MLQKIASFPNSEKAALIVQQKLSKIKGKKAAKSLHFASHKK